jgi:hypothetical protein
VVEFLLKVSELTDVMNKVSLHLGSDLLEELELLNNQVEIKHESLFNVKANIRVEGMLNVVALVTLLDFFDPHIQSVQFLFN